MTAADVPNVLDVQEPGAVRGLAEVFPQEMYPFPREEIALRWLREIAMADIQCHVVLVDEAVAGFAATRGEEFLHFGIAVEHWGTGLAHTAHDAVLDRMRSGGIQRAWLRAFTKNLRGRRFYENLGWQPTGAPQQQYVPAVRRASAP